MGDWTIICKNGNIHFPGLDVAEKCPTINKMMVNVTDRKIDQFKNHDKKTILEVLHFIFKGHFKHQTEHQMLKLLEFLEEFPTFDGLVQELAHPLNAVIRPSNVLKFFQATSKIPTAHIIEEKCMAVISRLIFC